MLRRFPLKRTTARLQRFLAVHSRWCAARLCRPRSLRVKKYRLSARKARFRKAFLWRIKLSKGWAASTCWARTPVRKKSQRSLSFRISPFYTARIARPHSWNIASKKEGIPYVVVGREDFLSALSVRHALNFFRPLLEPNNLLAQRYCQEEAETPALQSFRERLLGSSALTEASAQQLLLEFAEYQGVAEDASFERLLCIASQGQKLRDFLGNLSLGQESDFRRSGGRSYALDAVTLSTLHGAKGLEFDSVFLCGVNKGFLPLQNVSAADPGKSGGFSTWA